MTREELAEQSTSLSLPDNAGKEADSVGIAKVIAIGAQPLDPFVAAALLGKPEEYSKEDRSNIARDYRINVEVGDLIAYTPFTDAVIMEGYTKYNLVAYRDIRAYSKQG